MDRLCERPGCSEPASVAYGMRPEDLVFWLDRLGDGDATDVRVLCRRHADSMIVPRGWTLDDLRDPELHLFRPPNAGPTLARRARRAAGPTTSAVEQLELGVEEVAPRDMDGVDSDDRGVSNDATVAEVPAPGVVEEWSPNFDHGDDLDGLLAAHSPLLARAFRGADRPR